MNEPKKIDINPGDIRGISNPPDMGKLRTAEEVARRLVVVSDRGTFLGSADTHIALLYGEKMAGAARDFLADVIRQSRAEGAAVALDGIADRLDAAVKEQAGLAEEKSAHEASSEYHAGKSAAYEHAAALLRARIRTISNPPDMG